MDERQSGDLLLEREDELGAAERAVRGASGGSGTVLFVEGAAGIGKSRLLAASAQLAERSSVAVLRAAGARLESDFSFGVVLQLLAERVHLEENGDGVLAPEAESSLFRGAAGMARPVFEDSGREPGRVAGDAAFSVLHGLYWLVANIAEQSPLLACVDDVQWVDPPSLGFLNFLAQRVEELPVVLAVTQRTGEPSEVGELVAELRDRAGVVLRPAPLSKAASASYVRGALPDAEDEFCDACARMTRGNPLYLRELLAAVRNDALRPGADEADALASLSPESISRTVLARINRLPVAARGLADAVAVLGEGASFELAAKLARIGHDEAIEAADVLTAAEILTPEEQKSFVHPIVAGAVYDAIPPAQRAASHLAAADLLASAGSAPETVASHLLRAERGGGDWVALSLREAAERARAKGAQAAALRYLERALSEPVEAEVRGKLLAMLGLAQAESGRTEGSATLGEAVEAISDPVSRARALFDLGMIYSHGGRFPHAAEACDRGLRELGDEDPDLAAKLRALSDMSHTWIDLTDAGATRRRLEDAMADPALERSPEGRAVLAHCSVGLAFAGADAATLRAAAERALPAGEPSGDPFDGAALPLAAFAMALAGDLETAERVTSIAVDVALRHGSVLEHGAATQVRAVARQEAGRLEEALADAESAVEAGRWGWGATLPMAHARLVFGSIERGDLDAAERSLALPGGEQRWSVNVSFGVYLLARGALLHARGRAEEALEQILLAGRLAEMVNAVTPAVCPWRPAAAAILLERGEAERARELAEAELADARRFGAPGPIGVALRMLGLATAGSAGLELLEESESVLRDSQARLQLARTVVAAGSALRRDGHVRDARKVLRDGLDLAHRCGAVALADAAADELRVAGGRPRRRALRGVEALTASELRTARLAAEGLTNREIAERLFVTRRTVEMHLSAAYGKLELSSREQLAEALEPAATRPRA